MDSSILDTLGWERTVLTISCGLISGFEDVLKWQSIANHSVLVAVSALERCLQFRGHD